jgi:hypothetical protein
LYADENDCSPGSTQPAKHQDIIKASLYISIVYDPHYEFLNRRITEHGSLVLPNIKCGRYDFENRQISYYRYIMRHYCKEKFDSVFRKRGFPENFCDFIVTNKNILWMKNAYSYQHFANIVISAIKLLFERRIGDELAKNESPRSIQQNLMD